MKNTLYDLLIECKNRNPKYILEIIDKFNPLIKKYTYLLNYDDAEQDLILSLIEIVYNLPLEQFPNEW